MFYNYGTRRNAQVRAFNDFDLVYNAYGQTFTKHVNMADQIEKSDPVQVDVKAGEKYLIGNSVKIKYNLLDESGTVKELSKRAMRCFMKNKGMQIFACIADIVKFTQIPFFVWYVCSVGVDMSSFCGV